MFNLLTKNSILKKGLFVFLNFFIGSAIAVLISYLNSITFLNNKFILECIIYFFCGVALLKKEMYYRIAFYFPIFIILLFFGIIFNDISVWIKSVRFVELVFISIFFFILPNIIKQQKIGIVTFLIILFLSFYYIFIPRLDYQALKSNATNTNINNNHFSNQLLLAKFLDIDSAQVNLSNNFLKNKNILLDFWFSNCPPCNYKVKPLSKLRAKLSNKDTNKIILINDGSIDDFHTFKNKVSKMPKNLIYFYDVNGFFTKSMGVKNYPYEMVFKNGVLVRALSGFNKGGTDDLYIEDLFKIFNNEQ